MEKALFAQISEIKGKNASGYQNFTFQYSPTDDSLKSRRGMLLLLLRLKAQDEGLEKARKFFDFLKDKFYTAAGNNLRAMENSLEALEDLVKKEAPEGEFLVGCLWGSVLYIGKIGSPSLLLLREGKIRKIDFLKAASGTLFSGDRIVFTSSEFGTNFAPEDVAVIIGKENFGEAVKEFEKEATEKEGIALLVELSIQAPTEKTENIVISDLDTPKEGSEKEISKEGINLITQEEQGLTLPPLEFLKKWSPKIKAAFTRYLRELPEKITPRLKKLARFILKPWLPVSQGGLENPVERKRLRIIQIGAVLAILMILSVGIGVFNRSRAQEEERIQEARVEIEALLTDADNLKEINPQKAGDLLLQVEDKLSALPQEEATAFRETLERLHEEINKIFSADEKLFADLSTIKGGVEADRILFAGGRIYIFDKGTGSIYAVIAEKNVQVFASEIGDIENVAAGGETIYLKKEDSIDKLDLATKNETVALELAEALPGTVKGENYQDNFYLLDKDQRQIWKFTPSGGGLSTPQEYLEAPLEAEPVSFAIDGAVWVAGSESVKKFFGGREAVFSLKNHPKEIGGLKDLFTSEQTANLYLLDKSGLFIFDKEGNYLSFYSSGNLLDARSIFVDEASSTVYFLADNSLYTFALR